MLPHLKFASSSRWKWGTGRTRPQFPSLLTPGAVFPAQAGIRPKSNLLPAHQDGSTSVPWLTEAELELLPSCPKLPHRAWEKRFSWKCCFTQSRSYQSTSSPVWSPSCSHLIQVKARPGEGGAKSPCFLCLNVTLGHSAWESGFVWHPGAVQLGTLENKSQQNPARAWQPIWFSENYLKS